MIERRCPLCGKKEKELSCPKCAVLTEEVERQDLRPIKGLYLLTRLEPKGELKVIKVDDSHRIYGPIYGPFELRKAAVLANQLRYGERDEASLEEYEL